MGKGEEVSRGGRETKDGRGRRRDELESGGGRGSADAVRDEKAERVVGKVGEDCGQG